MPAATRLYVYVLLSVGGTLIPVSSCDLGLRGGLHRIILLRTEFCHHGDGKKSNPELARARAIDSSKTRRRKASRMNLVVSTAYSPTLGTSRAIRYTI